MKPVMVGDAAVLPTPDDNVAIATRDTYVGAQLVPEGHRFAVVPVESGAPLLSWGLPFGYATRDIAADEYLCTERMLEVLRQRRPDASWPASPNFVNRPLDPYQLESVVPGTQLTPYDSPTTFLGYPRSTGLAGTRNHIVVLGTTSRTGPFADALAREFGQPVVAVAHTEGGESGTPNNLELFRRTLEGFVVHPNVGALLIVDDAGAVASGSALADYARAHGHLDPVVLSYDDALRQGASVIASWLPSVGATDRADVPASQLRIALQCGGSDAFSGVSANPLAGSVAGEVIRHGGAAVLAETDELIGAEAYVLANVRSAEVARQFLAAQQAFRARVEAHGHTAEGNVSGGNILRGLYNVTLKSLGAARKRDPRVRLDYVIDYGERLSAPGYYFMDSPGNDLESVAGEVASGCNLIFFTTGNGSVTNFPFVPTVKFVSTSGRYDLLRAEMDVNAGSLLEGSSLDDVTARVFDLTVRVASGSQTAGERAGHSQVSIWRNWQQSEPVVQPRRSFTGRPLSLAQQGSPVSASWSAVSSVAADRVGLVLPTSICAGQVAVRICAALTERFGSDVVSRFVALPHTEGCGATVSADEDMWGRTALGYLTHPSVGAALLLEHGCEITHNDFFRERLRSSGVPLDRFGWASIQLDGGMESVTARVIDWFSDALAALPPWSVSDVDLGRLRVAVHAEGALDDVGAAELATLVRAVAGSGGTVVLPQRSGLWSSSFASVVDGPVEPTIPYGGVAPAGLHVMETPTDSWLETATGLGATGVDLMVVQVADRAVAAHRLVPVLQVSSGGADEDIDLALPGGLLDAVLATASRRYVPKLTSRGVVGFQVSRGLFGVSI